MGYPHKPAPEGDGRPSPSISGELTPAHTRAWVKPGRLRESRPGAHHGGPPDDRRREESGGWRGRGRRRLPHGPEVALHAEGKKKPHYLCVNADESGARHVQGPQIMRWTPHATARGRRHRGARHSGRGGLIYIRRRVHRALGGHGASPRGGERGRVFGPSSSISTAAGGRLHLR